MNKRHELQKNELADWLEHKIEDTRPYFPAIGVGIAAVVLVALGIGWFVSQRTAASAQSWNQFFAASMEPETERGDAFEQVIAKEGDSPAALWARQVLADQNLSLGARLMFTSREDANKRISEAQEQYQAILEHASNPDLLARATLGLARTYEAQGKPKEAQELYAKLAETAKGTVVGEVAAASEKRLSDPRDAELLVWFAEQKPKERPVPLPGQPGGVPPLPSDLPERPDIGAPGLGLDTPGGALPKEGDLSFPPPATGDAKPAPSDSPPNSDVPPSDDAPKADAPPADSAPGDDRPNSATPADEKPADDAGPLPE